MSFPLTLPCTLGFLPCSIWFCMRNCRIDVEKAQHNEMHALYGRRLALTEHGIILKQLPRSVFTPRDNSICDYLSAVYTEEQLDGQLFVIPYDWIDKVEVEEAKDDGEAGTSNFSTTRICAANGENDLRCRTWMKRMQEAADSTKHDQATYRACLRLTSSNDAPDEIRAGNNRVQIDKPQLGSGGDLNSYWPNRSSTPKLIGLVDAKNFQAAIAALQQGQALPAATPGCKDLLATAKEVKAKGAGNQGPAGGKGGAEAAGQPTGGVVRDLSDVEVQQMPPL